MILEEFDPSKSAVVNPWNVIKPVEKIPRIAIACYAYTTFERIVEELKADIIAQTCTANAIRYIYKAKYKDIEVALFMVDVGAPASAGALEDVYQLGVEKIIVFGTCGVLDRKIEDCAIIIPDAAVRDEGTSYHYMEASDEIKVNDKYINLFRNLLDELCVEYLVGKVWTTDGYYRETQGKVKRRKQQGCICVDMECSANAAVAQFRNKDLIQFFYAADNLDSGEWEERSLGNTCMLEEKDRIAVIALELARKINNDR